MFLKNFFLIFYLGVTPQFQGQTVLESITNDKEIPSVNFCEMVRHPEKYFDRKIRIVAALNLATEAIYLSDQKNCALSHDDQVGVGYAETNPKEGEELNTKIRSMRSVEFGGRAVVIVVGTLRNRSRRDFAWYRYRYEIQKIEEISQVVEEYGQELAGARTYRAKVQNDKNFGLALVNGYKLSYHYARRFEWTNLKDFPELINFDKRWIIFTVLSNEIKQMTENRWNVTIRCKIIRLE